MNRTQIKWSIDFQKHNACFLTCNFHFLFHVLMRFLKESFIYNFFNFLRCTCSPSFVRLFLSSLSRLWTLARKRGREREKRGLLFKNNKSLTGERTTFGLFFLTEVAGFHRLQISESLLFLQYFKFWKKGFFSPHSRLEKRNVLIREKRIKKSLFLHHHQLHHDDHLSNHSPPLYEIIT